MHQPEQFWDPLMIKFGWASSPFTFVFVLKGRFSMSFDSLCLNQTTPFSPIEAFWGQGIHITMACYFLMFFSALSFSLFRDYRRLTKLLPVKITKLQKEVYIPDPGEQLKYEEPLLHSLPLIAKPIQEAS